MAKKDKGPEVQMAPDWMDDERRYKAEDAHRTIMRAEEHKSDPDLMKDVKKIHEQRQKELARVKIEVSAPVKGKK